MGRSKQTPSFGDFTLSNTYLICDYFCSFIENFCTDGKSLFVILLSGVGELVYVWFVQFLICFRILLICRIKVGPDCKCQPMLNSEQQNRSYKRHVYTGKKYPRNIVAFFSWHGVSLSFLNGSGFNLRSISRRYKIWAKYDLGIKIFCKDLNDFAEKSHNERVIRLKMCPSLIEDCTKWTSALLSCRRYTSGWSVECSISPALLCGDVSHTVPAVCALLLPACISQ